MNDIHSDDVVVGVLAECTSLLCIEEAGGVKAVVVVLLLLVEIDKQTSAVANFDRPLDMVVLYIVFDRLIILQLIYELDKRRRYSIIGVVGAVVRLNYCRCGCIFILSGHEKETLLRPLSTVT